MKDFYDLWTITQTFASEGDDLAEAIRRTFERRRTPLPERVPVGLIDCLALKGEIQWRAFLARDHLEDAPVSSAQVVDDLRTFLHPMLIRAEVASWSPGGP